MVDGTSALSHAPTWGGLGCSQWPLIGTVEGAFLGGHTDPAILDESLIRPSAGMKRLGPCR